MKRVIIFIIRIYQYTISPDHGIMAYIGTRKQSCVFYPTCSEYCVEALTKYNSIKALRKAIKRISRCHPWQTPTIDLP